MGTSDEKNHRSKIGAIFTLIHGEIGGLVAKEGWEHNSEGNKMVKW